MFTIKNLLKISYSHYTVFFLYLSSVLWIFGGVAQWESTASHGRGQGFKSLHLHEREFKMKELIETVLNTFEGKNIEYGEIRVIDRNSQSIAVKNGNIETISEESEIGFGIRVYKNGGMGFASSSILTKDSAYNAAISAIKIAEASSKLSKGKTLFSEEKVSKDTYKTPYRKDPFDVPVEKKLSILLQIDEILRKKPEIVLTMLQMNFFKTKKYFASTEGHWIEQEILESGGGYTAYAFKDGELQPRSYPGSHGGNYHTEGWEFIESLKLLENAERIRDEAIALLSVKPCPEGVFDLILLPGQMVLQVHESIGHATELDRVLGYEASYAGTSFATLEKLGNFKYGSEIVNVTSDNTYPGGLGTYGYDDEGTPARKVYLIKNGILNDYLSSRDTAVVVGKNSTAAARASNYNRIPIVRMTNINLEPGDKSLEELIGGIDNGIMMDVNKSWSIDEKRLNFQFGCEIAWKIEKGRVTEMVRNPIYWGITPEFWNSCDGISKKQELFGLLTCGKGEPGQSMHVGHAVPAARFRKVHCGSKK